MYSDFIAWDEMNIHTRAEIDFGVEELRSGWKKITGTIPHVRPNVPWSNVYNVYTIVHYWAFRSR